MKKILLIFLLFKSLTFLGQNLDSCQIETTNNKFNYRTVHTFKGLSINLEKVYNTKGKFYYIAILKTESDIVSASRGASILLSNGELVSDSKANVSYDALGNGKMLVISSIELGALDIPSMIKYNITDFRLGNSIDVKVEDGANLRKALSCLLKK